jgi:hypothetical protein
MVACDTIWRTIEITILVALRQIGTFLNLLTNRFLRLFLISKKRKNRQALLEINGIATHLLVNFNLNIASHH